jgi:DNA polymerase-1
MSLLDVINEIAEVPVNEPAAGHVEVASSPKPTYEDFNYEDLLLYAGLDCVVTSGLKEKLSPEMERTDTPGVPEIANAFHSIVMPCQEFIIDLEINGMGYSVERNAFLSKKMSAEVEILDDNIFSLIGRRIDLNSGPVVAQFLYGEKGFTPPTYTKAGEPATDGEALLTLAGLDPLGNKYVTEDPSLQYLALMAKRKDIYSCHSTFVKTYVKDFVKRDGRIHPSYNQFGTSSFRITGTDPNLTQLPRPKHGYNVRSCYTVKPGFVFISFDFSSAEVKILANICRDPAMMEAVRNGLDFHTFSASRMRGIPYEEMAAVLAEKQHPKHKEYKSLRQLSKTLTFSILYGSSVAGIANQLFLSEDKAKELLDLYFTTFPKVKDYINSTHAFAKAHQFVVTPLGQRKRQFGTYPCFSKTAAYNAALRNSQNVIIQSATSSVGLVTFAELNERIKPFGAISTCTVYDSLEIECPQERAAEVIAVCYDTLDNFPMERFPFIELPIGCEGDVGISWGETTVVHPGVTQAEIDAEIEALKRDSITSFGKWMG